MMGTVEQDPFTKEPLLFRVESWNAPAAVRDHWDIIISCPKCFSAMHIRDSMVKSEIECAHCPFAGQIAYHEPLARELDPARARIIPEADPMSCSNHELTKIDAAKLQHDWLVSAEGSRIPTISDGNKWTGEESRPPRRFCMDRYTPAEMAISQAIDVVERAGCHPLLTNAVVLLSQAKDKVADFVDGVDTAKVPSTALSGLTEKLQMLAQSTPGERHFFMTELLAMDHRENPGTELTVTRRSIADEDLSFEMVKCVAFELPEYMQRDLAAMVKAKRLAMDPDVFIEWFAEVPKSLWGCPLSAVTDETVDATQKPPVYIIGASLGEADDAWQQLRRDGRAKDFGPVHLNHWKNVSQPPVELEGAHVIVTAAAAEDPAVCELLQRTPVKWSILGTDGLIRPVERAVPFRWLR